MSKDGEIYTTGKNFALPPGLTGWTNSTSGDLGIYTHPCWAFFTSKLIHSAKIESLIFSHLQGDRQISPFS